MEELPDKTSQFMVIDCLPEKDKQVFSKNLGNKTSPKKKRLLDDLNVEKEKTLDIKPVKLPDWNMFYHDFPLRSFVPDSLQTRNVCVLKTYRCQEEGILYIYSIAQGNELWVTLLDMKTMEIKSDFLVPISLCADAFIRIKACKVAFVVIDALFIRVFRIQEKTHAVELFKFFNTKMPSRMIKINAKYFCLGKSGTQNPNVTIFEVWNLNKREMVHSSHQFFGYRCWFLGDNFFILLWNWAMLTLNVIDLNVWNAEYCTILTKPCTKPCQMAKMVQLCPPYLITFSELPKPRYFFFNYETIVSEFYFPLTGYNIRKFYFAKDKIIGTTFTGHSFLFLLDSHEHATEIRSNLHGAGYQNQMVVPLSSRKIIGKIYPNDWTVCIPGGVFWAPSSNSVSLIDVSCNVAIYLQNKSLRFVTPIMQGMSKIWDLNQVQRELENEDLSAIHKLRRIHNLDDFESAHEMDLTVPLNNIFYPILAHRKTEMKDYTSIHTAFLADLNLKMFQDDKFCIQVIQAIRRLSLKSLTVDEERCIEKATRFLFDYLDQISKLSKFESDLHQWIHHIKGHITAIVAIDDEMKIVSQCPLLKRWDQFLSTHQHYILSSYETLLNKKWIELLEDKQTLDAVRILKEFKGYQITFANLFNWDGRKFYANATKNIFEKQYNDLRKRLQCEHKGEVLPHLADLVAHLRTSSVPIAKEEPDHSSINYWESEPVVQRFKLPDYMGSKHHLNAYNQGQILARESNPSFVWSTQPSVELVPKPEPASYCIKCQDIYTILLAFEDKIQSAIAVKEIDNILAELKSIENDGIIHFAAKDFLVKHTIFMQGTIRSQISKLEKQLDDRILYLTAADSVLSEYGAEIKGIENGDLFDIHVGARLEEMKITLVKYLNADRNRYGAMIHQVEALLMRVDYITFSKSDKPQDNMDYYLSDNEWGDTDEEEFVSDEDQEEEEEEKEKE